MPTTMMEASEFGAAPESASKNSECEWNADLRWWWDEPSEAGVELNALADPPPCTGVQLAICAAVGNATCDDTDSGTKFSTRATLFLTCFDVTVTGDGDPAWVSRLAPFLVLRPDRLLWAARDVEHALCEFDAARTRGCMTDRKRRRSMMLFFLSSYWIFF